MIYFIGGAPRTGKSLLGQSVAAKLRIGWISNDILAHLRACADVWGKDIQSMLEQDMPTLRHISPRTYIRKTNYPALEFRASLQQFIDQRYLFTEKLKRLEENDWSRGAQIENRQHTVFNHMRRMAQHELGHWQQLETLV